MTRRVARHSVSDAGSEDRVAGSCESTERSCGTGPRSEWGTTPERKGVDNRIRDRGIAEPDEHPRRVLTEERVLPDRGQRWIDSRRLPKEAGSAECSVCAIGKPIVHPGARRREHQRPGPAGAHGKKTSVGEPRATEPKRAGAVKRLVHRRPSRHAGSRIVNGCSVIENSWIAQRRPRRISGPERACPSGRGRRPGLARHEPLQRRRGAARDVRANGCAKPRRSSLLNAAARASTRGHCPTGSGGTTEGVPDRWARPLLTGQARTRSWHGGSREGSRGSRASREPSSQRADIEGRTSGARRATGNVRGRSPPTKAPPAEMREGSALTGPNVRARSESPASGGRMEGAPGRLQPKLVSR